MTVYVDVSRYPYRRGVRRMVMCHMLADTIDELHTMADRIGVARKWFQPTSWPHYDICKSSRELAIAAGAKVVSSRELVRLIRAWRAALESAPQERAA